MNGCVTFCQEILVLFVHIDVDRSGLYESVGNMAWLLGF